MMLHITVVAALAAAAGPARVDVASTVVPGAVAVVVAGQSNAEGRGEMLPEDGAQEPGVYVVKPDGTGRVGADPFARRGKGTGFQRTLARALVDAGYPQVWVVQCAAGGSTLRAWVEGKAPLPLMRFAGGRLYSDCLLQSAPLRWLGVPMVGVAWHQGESGCNSPNAMTDHEPALRVLRDRFASDFPGSAFIAGELADAARCTYKDAVHAALRAVADGVASSAGLTTNGGGVHFDRASQRELGRRYGDLMVPVVAQRFPPGVAR